jgi:hypothetical protein
MTTRKYIPQPGAADTHPPRSLEDEAALTEEAAGGGLRATEVALVVLLGLLVCPPLAIVTFLVFAPLLVVALVLGLLAAILSIPYLLLHHVRAHDRAHLSLLGYRLRHAVHALIDLAPHRIVADARKLRAGR